MGVCGKSYHLNLTCSGLDRYSSVVFDTSPMVRFMCDDCMLYVSHVDLVLKVMQEVVKKKKNSNYLKEYKSEFGEALKKRMKKRLKIYCRQSKLRI